MVKLAKSTMFPSQKIGTIRLQFMRDETNELDDVTIHNVLHEPLEGLISVSSNTQMRGIFTVDTNITIMFIPRAVQLPLSPHINLNFSQHLNVSKCTIPVYAKRLHILSDFFQYQSNHQATQASLHGCEMHITHDTEIHQSNNRSLVLANTKDLNSCNVFKIDIDPKISQICFTTVRYFHHLLILINAMFGFYILIEFGQLYMDHILSALYHFMINYKLSSDVLTKHNVDVFTRHNLPMINYDASIPFRDSKSKEALHHVVMFIPMATSCHHNMNDSTESIWQHGPCTIPFTFANHTELYTTLSCMIPDNTWKPFIWHSPIKDFIKNGTHTTHYSLFLGQHTFLSNIDTFCPAVVTISTKCAFIFEQVLLGHNYPTQGIFSIPVSLFYSSIEWNNYITTPESGLSSKEVAFDTHLLCTEACTQTRFPRTFPIDPTEYTPILHKEPHLNANDRDLHFSSEVPPFQIQNPFTSKLHDENNNDDASIEEENSSSSTDSSSSTNKENSSSTHNVNHSLFYFKPENKQIPQQEDHHDVSHNEHVIHIYFKP